MLKELVWKTNQDNIKMCLGLVGFLTLPPTTQHQQISIFLFFFVNVKILPLHPGKVWKHYIKIGGGGGVKSKGYIKENYTF